MSRLSTSSKEWADAARHYAAGRRFPLRAHPMALIAAPVIPLPFQLNATVDSVTDADTIKVTVDWGKRRRDIAQPIRLLGIASWENHEPGGQEATAHLRSLLPVGAPVALATIKDDKFAPRWDCQVSYLVDGVVCDLAADLVAGGWAVPWNGRGKQPKPAWPREVRS
jgi:endonuclease YncB( thermonuclease family)